MSRGLLTTDEVARMLRVGTSSVKRWAESGDIPCVKTPGGHRRFPRDAVERFLARSVSGNQEAGDATQAYDLMEELIVRLRTGNQSAAHQLLLGRESELGSVDSLCEWLGSVLVRIGNKWQAGVLSVAEEHAASETLSRVLATMSLSAVVPSASPCALLLMALGDEHTLGLRLLEYALRHHGWRSHYLGHNTPLAEVERSLQTDSPTLVAVSASIFSQDSFELARQAEVLGRMCAAQRVPLLLGGQGAWPAPPPFGKRVRNFQELALALP